MNTLKNYIDGAWVSRTSIETIGVLNPASNEVLAKVHYGESTRNEANAGNIGINIGVAAPMAQFPFSGWKDSFFGDLHGQGKHAIEFFTQTKVVIERGPNTWSRKFKRVFK